jgi:hypothetical protein
MKLGKLATLFCLASALAGSAFATAPQESPKQE